MLREEEELIPSPIAELLVGGTWGSWVTCTASLCDPRPQPSLLIYLEGTVSLGLMM